MRLPLIIASIVCSLMYGSGAHAAMPAPDKKPSSRKLGLNIQVRGGGWGKVPKEKIETVLYSVADELMSGLSRKLDAPIVVTHTDSNPIALYERGEHGEYLVHLHASEDKWHLYVYEFAHELCHLLSNYEQNVGDDGSKHNQWFEETLCETASLYTLKRLAAIWEAAPPSPEMAADAPRLSRFFNLLVNEGHRRLPPESPLANWLAGNEDNLRANPYLRDKNEVVANLLLPLFDRDPENWATLSYLNLDPQDARSSLRDYLHHWYEHAPAEQKTFVADVLTLFRLRDVMPDVPALPAGDTKLLAAAPGVAGEKAGKP